MKVRITQLAPLFLAASVAAQQDATGVLQNGGGESSLAVRVGEGDGGPSDLPGWESVEGDWVAQQGPGARSGGAFLRPSGKAVAVLRQTVELQPTGSGRPTLVVAGAWLRTEGKDAAELRLVLEDAARAPVRSASTGESSAKAWSWHEVVVPVGTAAVRATVELRGVPRDGDVAEAFFDDVALERVGPGWPASLAGVPAGELLARLDEGVEDFATWRGIVHALAVDARGRRRLAERYDREADTMRRRHLLALLAPGGGAPARDVLALAVRSPDSGERALALALLPDAGVDGNALLAPAAVAEDAAVRRDALRALAAAGDARTLAQIAGQDSKRAIEVIRAIRAADAHTGTFYRGVLAPWLHAEADARARDEAMRTLGASGDPRFLSHLVELAPKAGSRGVLGAWFELAAGFRNAAALDAIVAVVEDGVAHADRALLRVAPDLGFPAALDWARRTGLRHDGSMLRLAAVRILRAGGDAADVRALLAAVDDPDPLVAVEAVDAVGARSGHDADELLERLYTRGRPSVAAAALRELFRRAGGDADAVRRAMGAAGGHAHAEVRAAALQLLRGAAAQDALPVIRAAFADESWQVRAAAYRAAAAVRDKAVVEALIARMPDESAAAGSFLSDALVSLTGVDRGDDPRSWQRWWEIVGDEFQLPEQAGSGGRTAEDARTTTSYYGIPIRTDNLVFIIDLSGSMNGEIGGKTKLRAAKDELIAVLRALQPTQRFGIIAFGTEVGFYEPELVDASPRNIGDAVAWVDRLRIRGATNIYDSLERALQFEGVDSIFLLSDGGPSAGKFIDTGEIRRAVRLQNREKMVRINTVLIGGNARERRFMQALAEENHGEVGRPDERTR